MFQSPLHLVPAGFIHLPQDIETSQLQHQLRQEQVTPPIVAHHFGLQHLLHAGHAVVRVRGLAQVEEPPAFTAAQSFCSLVDGLKLELMVLVWESHGL